MQRSFLFHFGIVAEPNEGTRQRIDSDVGGM
jgi:hypothetical protein